MLEKFYKFLRVHRSPDEIRLKFMLAFGVFAVIIFFIYATVNLLIKDYYYAIFEYILSGIALVATYLTWIKKSMFYGKYFGPIPLFASAISNFVNGGFDNTGIYWCYTLPIVALFISGKRFGTILIFLFIGFISVYYLITKFTSFNLLYTDFQFLTFVVSFIVIWMMSLIYQLAWEQSEINLYAQKTEVEKSKEHSENKAEDAQAAKEEAEKALKDLKRANQELEKLNKLMVDRELKMIELKKQLKAQNA